MLRLACVILKRTMRKQKKPTVFKRVSLRTEACETIRIRGKLVREQMW